MKLISGQVLFLDLFLKTSATLPTNNMMSIASRNSMTTTANT